MEWREAFKIYREDFENLNEDSFRLGYISASKYADSPLFKAKRRCDDTVIATGLTHTDCMTRVDKLNIWDKAPGTVAPYYITTI